MPRPKQRTPELRDRVLRGALDLLDRHGAVGLTARTLARQAETSAAAVYELFGDKQGVLRAVYFEGFRRLHEVLVAVAARPPDDEDPVGDLLRTAEAYRGFMTANRALAEVMFERPFTDFSPGPEEMVAAGSVRELVVDRVAACTRPSAATRAQATDLAHVFVALVQGLAAAESAGRLGRSRASVERRWALGLAAFTAALPARRPWPGLGPEQCRSRAATAPSAADLLPWPARSGRARQAAAR